MGEIEYTLAEFEAWCKGEGRGGREAGWHGESLQHIANFRKFKRTKAAKLKANEEKRFVEAD